MINICIVRLSALGDVLMLVPLVRTLQAHFSELKISWVISRPAYDLVEGMDGVEFIIINKPRTFKDYWQFRKQLKNKHFDVLLACQASMRANLLYPFIKARRKIGYDKLRAKDAHHWFIKEAIKPGSEHTLEGFLKFAKPLGIKKSVIRWDLSISDDDYQWAKNQLDVTKKILIINPSASKSERVWPVERYIEVIEQAKALWDIQIILTGGPGKPDRELAEQITGVVAVKNLSGKTKPKQLLALISLANAVLCPDTGPSHMAAAVGTPVIALHAVTSASVSGPYLFQHLAIDYYPQAVEQLLGTHIEDTIWGTHVHGTETMKLIPVADVMNKLTQVLEKAKC